MQAPDIICSTDVAIIGMAGRFPGAASVDLFWENLCRGREAVTVFSDEQLRAAGVPEEALRDPAYIRARAVLDDAGLFDAHYFGMTASEATLTNPQQRLFLECAAEALADAGCDPYTHDGPIGVYAGAGSNGYAGNCHAAGLIATLGAYRAAIANDKDYLTTFTSYKLGLRGPSVTVQTACSTSLVAVHIACQALLGGECEIALAGGASVDVERGGLHFYQEGGILAPDGHCRAFDADARGTVGGSGVAIVVLKRLEDAVRDGDYVHAVIKGSAINNDGSLKLGYTAPSVEGQARAITDAQRISGVTADSITYVEAHGTATPLGDPMEVEALARAGFRGAGPPCAIGSVKTNIGHLDAAAGVAGLIKATLSVEHGVIPPSLHFARPNPRIDFAASRLFVNTTLAEWKIGNGPRRAGVSSFGIGGTNAHVILEQAPPQRAGDAGRDWQLLSLSAKTPTAVRASATALASRLRTVPPASLADVAYTLHVGRPRLEHRLAVVAQCADDAAAALEGSGVRIEGAAPPRRSLVFMFPGQGTQYLDMARGLHASEPVFRDELDRCFALLAECGCADLEAVLFPAQEDRDRAAHALATTEYTQVALFAVEYALARLLIAWGLVPDAMIGHSVGEYVAACISGCLSLPDALRLIVRRGRLMQGAPAGAMLAVDVSPADATAMLSEGLSLAAVNGPTECVLAGAIPAVEALRRRLEQQCIRHRLLETSRAFHSSLMDTILQDFGDAVRSMRLQPPRLPFVSNVSGRWITPAEAQDPNYWVRHVRATVRFLDGINELARESDRIYVEVGPGRVLSSLVARSLPDEPDTVPTLRGRGDTRRDIEVLLEAVGTLWVRGCDVAWPSFYDGQKRSRLRLPTYPFERQDYWAAPAPSRARRATATAASDAAPAASRDDFEDVVCTQLRVMSEQLALLMGTQADSDLG